MREATLAFPANRQTPIAARIGFAGGFEADLDWRYSEGERWTIRVGTADGIVVDLLDGGARLSIDGVPQEVGSLGEYPSLYARFAELIEAGESDVDREPLRLVADAFLIGGREQVEPFDW